MSDVVVHTDSPEAPVIVASHHCIVRFRQRMPVRSPGAAEVHDALVRALQDAHVMAWPPGWAVTDDPAELWAVSGDVAFPLVRTPEPGRWLAKTCLRRAHR